ncbi:MAG: polygalacturonase [Bacteroidia bacterium]|jgi:polygalacturonase
MKYILFICFCTFWGLAATAQDYNIVSYGAQSGSNKLSTAAIQKAIDQASSAGGGRVVVPKGEFTSGSLFLKSGVELHLSKGATLLGSTNPADYKKLGKWKGLILADNARGIVISGNGIIDGRGAQIALYLDSLFHAGAIDSIRYNLVEKRPMWYTRPQIIYFVGCENIRVTGVTLQNSACWVQTYEQCNRLIIDKIKVRSDAYWNNDGLDIVDSKNVRITNCNINAADDGICIKSEDWSHTYCCDSIYIADCTVRSSASAVKFGTSSVNDIKNVTIRNIRVYDTYRSAIAIEAMQGGVLENILVENITATNTGNALFLRIGQIRNAENPGVLRNVTLRNIKVTVPFERPDYKYEIRGPALPQFHNIFPSSITGIPGHPIQNVTLENITIIYPGRGNPAFAYMPTDRLNEVPELPTAYPEFSMFGELPAWGLYLRHVEGITLKNIKMKIENPDYRPAIVLDDVSNYTIESLNIKGDAKANPVFEKK